MNDAKKLGMENMARAVEAFARAFPPPPTRWQRLKWFLRIDKQPPPPVLRGLQPGATIRFHRYSPIGSDEQIAEQNENNQRMRKVLDDMA